MSEIDLRLCSSVYVPKAFSLGRKYFQKSLAPLQTLDVRTLIDFFFLKIENEAKISIYLSNLSKFTHFESKKQADKCNLTDF